MAENEKSIETKDVTPTPDAQPEAEVNVDYEARIQELMVETAKWKSAFDKSASETKQYKDKYRSLLSDQERASEEKADAEAKRQEEVASLRRQVALNDLEKRYIGMGYSVEQATKAANARLDGDSATEFAVQVEVQTASVKAKEQEWLASRPDILAGNTGEEEDPFLKGWGK